MDNNIIIRDLKEDIITVAKKIQSEREYISSHKTDEKVNCNGYRSLVSIINDDIEDCMRISQQKLDIEFIDEIEGFFEFERVGVRELRNAMKDKEYRYLNMCYLSINKILNRLYEIYGNTTDLADQFVRGNDKWAIKRIMRRERITNVEDLSPTQEYNFKVFIQKCLIRMMKREINKYFKQYNFKYNDEQVQFLERDSAYFFISSEDKNEGNYFYEGCLTVVPTEHIIRIFKPIKYILDKNNLHFIITKVVDSYMYDMEIDINNRKKDYEKQLEEAKDRIDESLYTRLKNNLDKEICMVLGESFKINIDKNFEVTYKYSIG